MSLGWNGYDAKAMVYAEWNSCLKGMEFACQRGDVFSLETNEEVEFLVVVVVVAVAAAAPPACLIFDVNGGEPTNIRRHLVVPVGASSLESETR